MIYSQITNLVKSDSRTLTLCGRCVCLRCEVVFYILIVYTHIMAGEINKKKLWLFAFAGDVIKYTYYVRCVVSAPIADLVFYFFIVVILIFVDKIYPNFSFGFVVFQLLRSSSSRLFGLSSFYLVLLSASTSQCHEI